MKAEILKDTIWCDQCGSAEARPVAEGSDREYPTTPDMFRVVECVRCGLWYLNPRPAVTELDTIYPGNYHAYNIRPPASQGEEAKPLVTRFRHWLYSQRFHHPLRFLREKGNLDLLDIGCGDGWMLDLYKIAGAGRITTFGVDFKDSICDVARSYGHTVYCGRFEDLDLNRKFDLINMSHVIEHVSSPTEVARKSFALLRPGGVFVLETPNKDTWDCRKYQAVAWGAYHIPRHWNLYDPRTIRRLGESAGFQLREVRFHPAPVHWVWTFHNLAVGKPGSLSRAMERMFSPLDVFRGGIKAFMLLATFTVLDMLVLASTGKTSNMMAIFQKPGTGNG